MKILQIRFQNLNSLAGTWHIDFTDPAYGENSLFAITGPTGAGKSTLLDAICLALYGRTPRLSRITKTSNEIMSRHTGICFAEVEFKTVKGHFRCHWSQHRSRQQPGGELQQPRHEIADAASSTILESQLRNVASRVEEVTGMDFDRFTRSTLLAQGGFAAFLQASPDNRAPILEQITGTEIYSRLSIKVHELRNEEQARLQELKQTLTHINLLSPEEEVDFQKVIREREQQSELDKKEITETRQKLDWLNTLSGLNKEIEEYNRQLQAIAAEEKDCAPQLKRLPLALAAREIEPVFLEYKALITSQDKDLAEIKRLQSTLETLLRLQKNSETACRASEQKLEECEREEKNGQKLIKEVREVDLHLQAAEKQLQERTHIGEDISRQQQGVRTSLKDLEQKLALVENRKKKLLNFFRQQVGDEKLGEEFSALEMEINSILHLQERSIATSRAQKKAHQEMVQKKEAVSLLVKEETALQKKVADLEHALRILKEKICQLLQGRRPETLQEELFLLLNREKTIQDLLLLIEDQTVQTEERATLHRQILQDTKKEKELNTTLDLVRKEITSLLLDIELLEKNLLLLARIQSLEAERNHLQDGTPCPLCGATSHPYSQGNIPRLSKEEARLEETKTKLSHLEKKSTDLTRRVIICREQQNSCSRRLKTCDEELAKKEKTGEGLLLQLKLPALKQIDLQLIKASEQDLIRQKVSLQQSYERLQELNKKRAPAEEEEKALLQTRQNLEKNLLNAKHQFSSAETEEQRLIQEERLLAREQEERTKTLLAKLAAYHINSPSAEKLPDILKELAGRSQEWKKKKEEEAQVAGKILTLRSGISHHQDLLAKLTIQAGEKEQQRRNSQEALTTLGQKRQELFGSKNTDDEANRLESLVKESRKKLEENKREYAASTNQITAASTLEKNLQSGSHKRRKEIEEQQKGLDQLLNSSPFADLDQFLRARLQSQELEQLLELQKHLQTKKTKSQTLLEDKKNTLQKEEARQLCQENGQELKEKLVEQEKQLEHLLEQAGAARERLKKNEADKINVAEKLAIIDKQKQILGRWNRLHMLIGSADGKKFRNFAQGLTFEMMISHANAALACMNNRYILIRDRNVPLDLNVIDTYQAGEVRSTRNLSGGESFLVSLSLALGLSRMTSNNVRVDSLFLDEGFGTLDEETLEAALDALSQLRDDNKLIGIISHVGALKERIPLQIEITPGNGGRSTAKGPGVTRDSR